MFSPSWLHQLRRHLLGFPTQKSGRTRTHASVHRRIRPCLEALEDRIALAADSVQTAAANVSATFGESSQNVALTATVKDTTNTSTTVGEGTVTFTVKDSGGTQIGTPVQGTVSNGAASATFSLPSDEPAGNYTIAVSYSDTASSFTDGGDTSGTLAVNAANTTTAASNATATFSSSAQNVTLSATVTSSAGTVNEGSVSFSLVDGSGNTVGTATSGNVTNGAASVSFALPAGAATGTYAIHATYTDSSGNFVTSSDNTHSLTVSGLGTTTTASSATATFNTTAQVVNLTATVTSTSGTVSEGSVSFTLLDSDGDTVGTSTSGNVNNGSASVNFALPSGTPAGSYTILADYTDTGGQFATSSDDTRKLTVNTAGTTTTASSTTTSFSSSAQDVTLNATVTSSAGTVNEGSVSFTLLDSNGNVVGTATSGDVIGGSASVSYVLPAGTAIGNYTIEASYLDSGGNFTTSSDVTHTLTVSTATTTSLSLTSASIVPNTNNSTAQITLTALVSNPNGLVTDGVLTFTFDGVSGQGNVSQGTATVQLTVPLQALLLASNITLSYDDTAASGNFANATVSQTLASNIVSTLLPSTLTFATDGSETISIQIEGQALFSFDYANSGLLTQINTTSQSLPVQYSNVAGNELVTIDGAPWQVNFFNSNGQYQGLATLILNPDSSTQWLFFSANGQAIGAVPT